MYIKLRLVVERLFTGAPMRFDGLGENQKTAVTLRPPDQEEHEQGLFYHTIGEAHAEVEPPRKAAPTFEALWESRIPPGVDLSGVPEAIRANWKAWLLREARDSPGEFAPVSAGLPQSDV